MLEKLRSWLDKVRTWPSRLVTYSTEVRSEMKKVTWPSRKEVYGTTVVVIVTVFFFGFYLFFVDSLLHEAVQRIFSIFL